MQKERELSSYLLFVTIIWNNVFYTRLLRINFHSNF